MQSAVLRLTSDSSETHWNWWFHWNSPGWCIPRRQPQPVEPMGNPGGGGGGTEASPPFPLPLPLPLPLLFALTFARGPHPLAAFFSSRARFAACVLWRYPERVPGCFGLMKRFMGQCTSCDVCLAPTILLKSLRSCSRWFFFLSPCCF